MTEARTMRARLLPLRTPEDDVEMRDAEATALEAEHTTGKAGATSPDAREEDKSSSEGSSSGVGDQSDADASRMSDEQSDSQGASRSRFKAAQAVSRGCRWCVEGCSQSLTLPPAAEALDPDFRPPRWFRGGTGGYDDQRGRHDNLSLPVDGGDACSSQWETRSKGGNGRGCGVGAAPAGPELGKEAAAAHSRADRPQVQLQLPRMHQGPSAEQGFVLTTRANGASIVMR